MSQASFKNIKRYGWENHMNIMKKVNTLCNNSNLNELYLNDNNSSTYIKNIQLTKLEELSSHQYNLITNIKKLKFYSIFKKDCHRRDCLNIITNINHKKHWINSDLATIAYKLKRANIPKTQENLRRICPFCHLNEVEQELHLLFNFNLYDSLRSNFYRKIGNRYLLFNNFDNGTNPLHI